MKTLYSNELYLCTPTNYICLPAPLIPSGAQVGFNLTLSHGYMYISRRSSWSSDSGGNSPRRPPPSSDSGSSIDSTADEREQRKRRARRREHLSTCTTDLFTPSEDRAIRESLRRKLLLNDGVRLSRVERRLSHADRRGDGLVGISAFKDAFATEETAVNRSSRVARDETSWLIENLRTRNGKKVAILEMRSLLQSGREELDNRGSSVDSFEGGQSRRRRRSWSHQPERDEQRRVTWRSASRIGRDLNNHSLDNRRRLDISSPLDPPAKWAIRHGSVGRWLHDVAAPLVRRGSFASSCYFSFSYVLRNGQCVTCLDAVRVDSYITTWS